MRRGSGRIAVFVSFLMISGAFAGVAYALDPLDGADADSDPDRDGLKNSEEFIYGTDPTDPDSDGGGAFDGWEIWYEHHRGVTPGGDEIISPAYHFDANGRQDEGVVVNVHTLIQVRDDDASVNVNDPDNDGWNNLHEFWVGSDPTDPNTDDDCFETDSVDPDPLVSNGVIETPDERPDGNGGNSSGFGNGGGSSGVGLGPMEG
jgi:hypothetical protein